MSRIPIEIATRGRSSATRDMHWWIATWSGQVSEISQGRRYVHDIVEGLTRIRPGHAITRGDLALLWRPMTEADLIPTENERKTATTARPAAPAWKLYGQK